MTYLLKGIDPALWSRVKARAQADGGISLRVVLLKLLEHYASGALVLGVTSAPRD